MTKAMSTMEVQVEARVAVPPVAASGLFRSMWEHWKQIAKAAGVVQTRLLMVFFYFVIVFPLGLIVRRSGDPLHLKPSAAGNWTPHRNEPASLDTARRQF